MGALSVCLCNLSVSSLGHMTWRSLEVTAYLTSLQTVANSFSAFAMDKSHQIDYDGTTGLWVVPHALQAHTHADHTP